MEYGEQKKAAFESLKAGKAIEDLPARVAEVLCTVNADDKAGEFLFKTTSATLVYAANRIPEIADDIVNVDRAMRWGFAWEMGPFEIWDALGVAESPSKRWKAAGFATPGLGQGNARFGQGQASTSAKKASGTTTTSASKALQGSARCGRKSSCCPVSASERSKMINGNEPVRFPVRHGRRRGLPGIPHQDEQPSTTA